MTVRGALGVAVLALFLGSCRAGTADTIELDGSPRVPDDQGVVTAISARRVTLDDKDVYSISPDVRSFSTLDLSIVPLVQTKGQYVQVGLRGTTVVWLARIADVVRTDHAAVFYVGHLKEVQGRRLIMRDGTVLELADGVAAPAADRAVTAEIDPAKHAVVKITAK